ncbi:MAG: D-alanyl-D-alanine carboxypeptidase family protein, partial [Anaerovoracaceae bacterium]
MRGKLICLMLALLFLFGAGTTSVFAVAKDPVTSCGAALIIDNKTGEVLYQKNSEAQMTPASLTKIMTCILVLEALDMDKKVTITKEATGFQGNQMELKEGEVLTVEQLVNSLMVYSANDAAVALAIEVAGSEAEFVSLMNQRAEKIGATHTRFLNPNGFTESLEHTTTASDMMLITREALKNETFRKIVSQPGYTVPKTNLSEERVFVSTNRLLFDEETPIVVDGKSRTPKYEGAFGVKTGMMLSSGYCLIAGAKREDTELLAVVLNTKEETDRFVDAISLLDFGFKNFYTYELMAPGADGGKVKVKYGHKTRVKTIVANGAYETLPAEGLTSLASSKIVLDKGVKAPIEKGTKVGVVEIYEGDEKVGEADVVITQDVKKGGPWAALYISDLAFYTVAGVILLLILTILFLRARKKKLERIREEKRRR